MPDEWTFESTVARPDGTQVRVTVTVPTGSTWKDIGDAAEIAQMTASRAMSQIVANQERCPF